MFQMKLKNLLIVKIWYYKNIFRIQGYDSIICGYFCIGFINFMFKGKTLNDYTNLFSLDDFEKKDDIIMNYFINNTYV